MAYTWLNHSTHDNDKKHKAKWEVDLGIKIRDIQKEKACIMAHKCSLSTKYLEISYKILTQWYLTPQKATKWSQSASDSCQ